MENIENLKDVSFISSPSNSTSDKNYNELLSLLGLDIRDLSTQADDLLTQMAKYKNITKLCSMDPMSVHCWYTDLLLERIDLNQYILALEQSVENAEIELKNDKRELEMFKCELDLAKENIAKEQAAMSDFTKLKRSKEAEIQKYEQTLAMIENKLAKYHIPAEVLPENIKFLENELKSAHKERDEIKTTAQNINLTKSARKDLTCLKKKEFKL